MIAGTREAPSALRTRSDSVPEADAAGSDHSGPRPGGELPRWRLYAARLVSVAVVASGIYYLYWRLSTLDGAGALGLAFYAAEVLNFAVLVLTAILFRRLRYRRAPTALPALRLDVFITVCGEPVGLVEEALRAAEAIEHRHRTYLLNDGRLAGKANWQDVEQLAARHGVVCLTRTSGTRGKAGNLNNALEQTDGELIAVIDCDHRASPALAHELLGYFSNPHIGFVTTRQEFHADRLDLLGTREPLFFSWSQPAKDAAGAAISTGSGVVYRRSALDSIGGFSEWSIIEDFHTSIRLHADGWQSAYHPHAVTIGSAPRTAAALVKQRLTWATDSARVGFFDNPLWKRGLSLGQRFHHFHTASYYLVASTQLIFLVSPALWLIWHVPVMAPDSTESYVLHSLPYAAATFALLMIYGGRRGMRAIQQQLYLAPVYAFGVARAATGIRFSSGVSEKVLQSRFSPLTVPQQLIAALLVVAIAVAFARPEEGQAAAVAWAAFFAYSLTAFITTVSGNRWINGSLRVALRTAIVLLAALVVLPAGDRLRPDDGAAEATPAWDGPPLALAAPSTGAYVGVFNPFILQSVEGLTRWNQEHGAQARIVHWYQQWLGDEQSEFPAAAAALVAAQGAVPLITWEPPGEAASDTGQSGEQSVLAAIAAGGHDAYIRSWARRGRGVPRARPHPSAARHERLLVPVGCRRERQLAAALRRRLATPARPLRGRGGHERRLGVVGLQLRAEPAGRTRSPVPGPRVRRLGLDVGVQLGRRERQRVADGGRVVRRHLQGALAARQADHDLPDRDHEQRRRSGRLGARHAPRPSQRLPAREGGRVVRRARLDRRRPPPARRLGRGIRLGARVFRLLEPGAGLRAHPGTGGGACRGSIGVTLLRGRIPPMWARGGRSHPRRRPAR